MIVVFMFLDGGTLQKCKIAVGHCPFASMIYLFIHNDAHRYHYRGYTFQVGPGEM